MKSFILAAIAASASASTYTMSNEFMLFINYVGKFNKTYESVEEFEMRFEAFRRTHVHISVINSSNEHTHTAGHN